MAFPWLVNNTFAFHVKLAYSVIPGGDENTASGGQSQCTLGSCPKPG